MLSTKLRLFPDHRAGRPAAPGDEARGGRGLPPVTSLMLKRASASRPSGEWNDEDFDVLADGAVVGRIFKVHAAPVGAPWCGRSDIRSTACPRTAMPQPARPRWRRSPRVGGGGRLRQWPAIGWVASSRKWSASARG